MGRGLKWLVVVYAIIVGSILLSRDWNLILGRNENRYIVSQFGIFGYAIYDLASLLSSELEESRINRIDTGPFKKFLSDLDTSRYRAISSDPVKQNVIFLQLESVDGFCLWADFEGKPVMPRLRELAGKGIAFRNAMDMTHAGRTVDAEMLVLTSTLPIRGRPIFVNYDLNQIPSLPRVLGECGYSTMSFHGYDGFFWNRENAHRSLGYDVDFFRNSIEAEEYIGWGVSDREVLDFAFSEIRQQTGPVFAHIILLTHHHPYDHVGRAMGNIDESIEANTLKSLAYVDAEIGAFYDRLLEAGELEDTVLAVFGDHDSGITLPLADYIGYSLPPVWDSVPFFIIGLDEERKVVDELVGLQDLPVIVLNELGIAIPPTYIGDSLETIGNPLSYDGYRKSLVDGNLVSEQVPIDLEVLTKLALIRPGDLHHN